MKQVLLAIILLLAVSPCMAAGRVVPSRARGLHFRTVTVRAARLGVILISIHLPRLHRR